MKRPIKPSEVTSAKALTFPEAVFDAFNELIVRDFAEDSATVDLDEVVALMVSKGLNETEIHKKGWLNVEAVYRKAGWEVEFDQPDRGDTGCSQYTFTKKRRRS